MTYTKATWAKMKAATLGLLRHMNREDYLGRYSGYEAFEQGSDYIRSNYPEFDEGQINHCVSYAMELIAKA